MLKTVVAKILESGYKAPNTSISIQEPTLSYNDLLGNNKEENYC